MSVLKSVNAIGFVKQIYQDTIYISWHEYVKENQPVVRFMFELRQVGKSKCYIAECSAYQCVITDKFTGEKTIYLKQWAEYVVNELENKETLGLQTSMSSKQYKDNYNRHRYLVMSEKLDEIKCELNSSLL